METHDAVASFDHSGKLTVWTSTQSSYYTQRSLAGILDLTEGDVRVINPPSGGGFGSRLELDSAQFCASVLSIKSCRPVKIVLTREEEFTATERRTPIYYHIGLGAKEAGEGPTNPTAGAMGNAAYRAVRMRINHLPITPEKVFKALREKEGQSRQS